MRIHHLHIEAIGPFPGSHDVNFDELSAGGLFLLEGPTGAGKSTLIDAITFGLYGTLGKELDTRLPSAHAPLTEPVIEVVFSTSAGIHRARRTPPWSRPKKRGEGVTPQNATAKLWRLSSVDDPVGEPLAAGAQEVGTEVQRLVHLTRDQFMQTVVLPQGRFSTFLRAKPDERADVLRDVFGTAIYQQMQDQLAEMARSAKREISVAEAEMSSAVRAFTHLLLDDDPAVARLLAAGSVLDEKELRRITGEAVASMQRECATARDMVVTARAAESAARTALDVQKDLERTLARRASLLAEHRSLMEREDCITSHRQRLATGQRAATVSGVLRAHAVAVESEERTRQALGVHLGALREGDDPDLAGVTDLVMLRDLIHGLSEERGGLLALAGLEAGLPAAMESLVQAEALLERAVGELGGERDELAQRPELREQLVGTVRDLRREATPVSVAEQSAEQRRTVRDAARRAEKLCAELERAQRSLAAAAVRAAELSEREGALRLRWINSMAGTLARGLEVGEPCPVCGAVEHPSPAPELPDHATLEDVEEATTVSQEAVAALRQAETMRVQTFERLEAQQEAAGHASVADAAAALTRAEADVAVARNAVRLIDEAEKAVNSFDSETEALRLRVMAGERTAAATSERLSGQRTQVSADQERCQLAAGTHASVAHRVKRLDARLAMARRLVDARQEHHDATHRLADATSALAESLGEAGFANVAAARAAEMHPTERTHCEILVHTYDADAARVSGGLAEDAVAALSGDESVDVSAATAMHDDRCEAVNAAAAQQAVATAMLERCEHARRGLTATLEQHRSLTQRAAAVIRMGDLANAGEGNLRSTTLSTFVLLRRFEDVVAAANDRLTIMSGSRFSLLRTDEREARARRAGLGLVVRDHHTETNRDPHTLSGGETFYVSLCLALGLADVVTSEAGGLSLDTLFIDEGFGSLDPDTLDGVLGELSRLQAGGRSVGIVSHVAELKTRIPERVEITRGARGGSTLSVRA